MPSSESDPSPSRAHANDWLKAFSLALRNVGLYSAQHPRARESVERAYESLRRSLQGRREVVLSRTEGRLFLDNALLDRDRELSRLIAEDLASRGVDSIIFLASVTPEDYAVFLRCLLLSPDRIHEKEGLQKVLSGEGVASIRVDSGTVRHSRSGGEGSLIEEMVLLDFLTQLDEEPADPQSRKAGAPTADSVLSRAPAALARAIASMARESAPWTAKNPSALAGILAAKLERIAARAIAEKERDRAEVVKDVGRAMVGSDPEIHSPLFLEHAAPGSEHSIVTEAVESLPPTALGELVAIHYPHLHGDYRDLNQLLDRSSAWRVQRTAALDAAGERLRAFGAGAEEISDLVDRLLWNEVGNRRRLELLYKDNSLWHMEFSRLQIVLTDLLQSGQVDEASSLVRKFMSGLMAPDLAVRHRVAQEIRGLVELLAQHAGANSLLQWVIDVALTRLPDEKNDEIAARLSEALTFVGDRMLRSGDLAGVLALLRRADGLVKAGGPSAPARGRALADGLERTGDDATRRSLVEMALHGSGESCTEARAILERGQIPYLLEQMATEGDRSRRSELVNLLKGFAGARVDSFVPYLRDARWYVVRNVVAILASTGNSEILPDLDAVARHPDPRVRKEFVRAVAQFSVPQVEERIARALSDVDSRVQIAAVNALVTCKSSRSFETLATVARAAAPFETVQPEVRQEAVIGLGKLGQEAAFAVLSEIVTRKGLLGHAAPTDLRVAATKALSLLGTSQARAVLEELAAGDPRSAVREAASQGVRRSTSPA